MAEARRPKRIYGDQGGLGFVRQIAESYRLGPPVVPFHPVFWGGVPYQSTLQKKGTLILASLLEGLVGVLTSNKEGKVICEIDGWVLVGVQFEVLVLFGVLFKVRVTVSQNCEGRVLGHAVLGCCMCCLGVLSSSMVPKGETP